MYSPHDPKEQVAMFLLGFTVTVLLALILPALYVSWTA
jgi:hypothetical protein|tara:strand:- start:12 stop:125 length:114 start_codon:yes stop_codon:yes gene_type:complete